MGTPNGRAPTLIVLLATACFPPSVQAADLSGAWAKDASVCNKVFVKNNNRISLTPDSELYGGGFLIEGNRASGTLEKCSIKSIKVDGTNIHLTAACSTGVMVQDLHYTVKVIGKDQISVSLAGPVNTEPPYVRCPL
jgi:hypothetical protein